MLKKVLAVAMAICLLVGMAACKKSVGETVQGVTDSVSTAIAAQGRDYNNLITQKVGETTKNQFFEWTVNSVRVETGSLHDYAPTDGTKYIIANITVKNIFDNKEPIPVGNFDYSIAWGENEEDIGWAYDSFYDEMFTDYEDLIYGSSLSGEVVFEVPVDVKNVSIIYDEIYEDEFVGNTYCVDIDLSSL